MSEGGLQNSGSLRKYAQIGPSSSFSYVDGKLANQASIAARSYSDVGSSTFNNQDGSTNLENILEVISYQQYNNYSVTEVEVGAPHYYPCSYVAGKPGVGSWSLRVDPEVKRKGRLAGYRAISFEGKMKSSMRKSFKWIKHKCFSMLGGHGGTPT
eukprot:c1252_g1_i1 orf=143-607(-)